MRLRSVVQFTLASGLLGLASAARADLVWDSTAQEVTVKSSDLMANTSAGGQTLASSVHFKFTNTGPSAVTLAISIMQPMAAGKWVIQYTDCPLRSALVRSMLSSKRLRPISPRPPIANAMRVATLG